MHFDSFSTNECLSGFRMSHPSPFSKTFPMQSYLIPLLKDFNVIKLIAEKDIILLLIRQFTYSIMLDLLAERQFESLFVFFHSNISRFSHLVSINMPID